MILFPESFSTKLRQFLVEAEKAETSAATQP
jgi:hypothetical protein